MSEVGGESLGLSRGLSFVGVSWEVGEEKFTLAQDFGSVECGVDDGTSWAFGESAGVEK